MCQPVAGTRLRRLTCGCPDQDTACISFLRLAQTHGEVCLYKSFKEEKKLFGDSKPIC